jgi:hypothetical protein
MRVLMRRTLGRPPAAHPRSTLRRGLLALAAIAWLLTPPATASALT